MTEKKFTYRMVQPTDLTAGKVRVLVYGSLKRGKSNHHLLADETHVGCARVQIPGRMVCLGGFPGMIRQLDGPTYELKGEVYEVSSDALNGLDYLEGHPRFYRRDKYKTTSGVRVWVYTLPDAKSYDRYETVASGCWRPTEEEAEFWNGCRDE